jgi:hypothetical protein
VVRIFVLLEASACALRLLFDADSRGCLPRFGKCMGPSCPDSVMQLFAVHNLLPTFGKRERTVADGIAEQHAMQRCPQSAEPTMHMATSVVTYAS